MKKGFTLIEMLVVVLIIGILASIALPQYTRAVEKAKVAQALITLKYMRERGQEFMLAHGLTEKSAYSEWEKVFPLSNDNIGIELPSNWTCDLTVDEDEFCCSDEWCFEVNGMSFGQGDIAVSLPSAVRIPKGTDISDFSEILSNTLYSISYNYVGKIECYNSVNYCKMIGIEEQ